MLLPTVVTPKDLSQVLKKARSFQNSMKHKCQCTVCKQALNFDELSFCSSNSIPLSCSTHSQDFIDKRLKERRAHISKNISSILAQKGVPPRFINCSFLNFHCPPGDKNVLNKCHSIPSSLSSQNSQGAFLMGPNGTGKTHLAVSILRATILRGILNCRFIKLPNLLFEVKTAFNNNSSDSEGLLIQRFLDYDLLILDELGVEKATDWSLQTLYLIIDGRSSNLKKTVITSNLALQEIQDSIDARFASRIVEMCTLVKVVGQDYRLLSKKNKLKGVPL